MRTWLTALLTVALILSSITIAPSCGGGAPSVGAKPDAVVTGSAPAPAAVSGWPSALPEDHLQPWDVLDGDGLIVPRARQRGASSITAATEFVPGVERELEGGDVHDLGEAARMGSGLAGSQQLSYATYRIPLGTGQPGTVAVDVNLQPVGGGTTRSAYYVGLSAYTAGGWEWHGPFNDSHIRLSPAAAARAGADYTSTLGSVFICVAAWDGAAVDVVGVGVNALDIADVTAPPAPSGLTATPVAGGLSLEWNLGAASDLAGYRIYWGQSIFVTPADFGVRAVDYLEGLPRHVLLLPNTAPHYVAVSAVDLNGNESGISPVVSGAPLLPSSANLNVDIDQISVPRGAVANLQASGADSYDFDLNGDGSFELTNSTGVAVIDTTAPGIIRPLVRGTGGGGYEALGGVSLIVLGNTRPVASAIADPGSGVVPLTVNLTGTADDLEDGPGDLTYAWDYTGDGTYESGTNHLTRTPIYSAAGIYNVKFRVTDSQGAWDVDTVTVRAEPKSGVDMTTAATATRSAPTGATVYGERMAVAYQSATNELMFVRATNADASSWGTPVQVLSEDEMIVDLTLALVNGAPAIAYYTDTSKDLIYARATNLQGSAWNPSVTLDSANDVGRYCEIVIAAGNPAVGYYDATSDRPIFIRSIDVNGAAWAARVPVDVAGNGDGATTAMVEGYPAMAYGNSGANKTYFCRATNIDGSAWGAAVEISASNPAEVADLEVIGGAPCIIYTGTGMSVAYFSRAEDAVGSAWWPSQIACRRSTGSLLVSEIDLAEIGGVPAIALCDLSLTNNTLWYCEARDSTGLHWNWPVVVAPYEVGAVASGQPQLAELNGMAAIAHTYRAAGSFIWDAVVSRCYR